LKKSEQVLIKGIRLFQLHQGPGIQVYRPETIGKLPGHNPGMGRVTEMILFTTDHQGR